MANEQRPKTPRFFVDMMSYLHATGHGKFFKRNDSEHTDDLVLLDGNGNGSNAIYFGEKSDLLYCNTSSLVKFQLAQSGAYTLLNYEDILEDGTTGDSCPTLPIDCCVVLNHNFEGLGWVAGGKDAADSLWTFSNCADLINSSNGTPHNGFTIRLKDETFYTTNVLQLFLSFAQGSSSVGHRYMGAFFFGKSWTPNIDPKVTMSREFDGIKVSKTKGGFSHHNVNYLGNPLWSGHNAWELWSYPANPALTFPMEDPNDSQQEMFVEDDKANLGRLGRRKWTISFTHIADYDLHAALEQTNWNSFDGNEFYPDNSELRFTQKGYNNPILEEDNFMSRLWIPTLGGTIPFVFQANTEYNSPDQFAVCTFDKHSISILTLAPNMYSISFNISEVW